MAKLLFKKLLDNNYFFVIISFLFLLVMVQKLHASPLQKCKTFVILLSGSIAKCHFGMHTKACSLEYPCTNVTRFPVPAEFVDWKVSFPDYKPVDYTAQKVLEKPPWADPDIR